ncbi:hypothetical protein G7Z17_g8658 [Cylindrodendrum hubeiense]|uniref:Uncharacterized protein n=1 Tax=Cylindrodendrum hubeiense TaxID=595255 RepID=A0A9P5LEH2_9HYPO|nr:hypothetical protein G7Z17_g8658 [Cylindrodendrum hubeiense]
MAGISGGALIAVEWALIGIAFCLIIARLNLRLNHLGGGLLLSDGFILAAFASGIALNAVDITLYLHGVYKANVDFELSQYTAPADKLVETYKIFYFLYIPFYTQQYFNKGRLTRIALRVVA